MALSKLKRCSRPFPVDNDNLAVKAWFRAVGLRGAPVAQVDGCVDTRNGTVDFAR
jgi:hypothetical protein